MNNTTTTIDGVTISFSSPFGGTGEYVGNPASGTGNVAVSPFGTSNETGIYLDATASGLSSATRALFPGLLRSPSQRRKRHSTYCRARSTLTAAPPGYQNQVTVDGITYTGFDVAAAALGSTAAATTYGLGSNGTAIAAVEITGLTPFTTVTFEDDGDANGSSLFPAPPPRRCRRRCRFSRVA